MNNASKKYRELTQFIEEKGRNGVIVAFSGGVDSSTLAAVTYSVLGERAVAVTARSPTYPPEELNAAQKIAKEIGIKHYILDTNELLNEDFITNSGNRCYYCKTELLDHLVNFAAHLRFATVFEGTNFDDLDGHRPGFRAVKEHKTVLSPWVENRFTKKEIRSLAQQLSLSVYNKPSLACLASRVPFGEQITVKRLERITKAEQIVKKITGVHQLRVRDHRGLARIEVGKNERSLLYNDELLDKIAEELKLLGFKFATLDLEGYRTGSMTATLAT